MHFDLPYGRGTLPADIPDDRVAAVRSEPRPKRRRASGDMRFRFAVGRLSYAIPLASLVHHVFRLAEHELE